MYRAFIAKIVVVSTVAVMAFGLLSMVYAMRVGMQRCPIMATTPTCSSFSMGISFFNHHIDAFQSLALATVVGSFVLCALLFVYSRVVVNRPAFHRARSYEKWNFATGPPSPVFAAHFWSALHNKSGGIMTYRARKETAV